MSLLGGTASRVSPRTCRLRRVGVAHEPAGWHQQAGCRPRRGARAGWGGPLGVRRGTSKGWGPGRHALLVLEDDVTPFSDAASRPVKSYRRQWARVWMQVRTNVEQDVEELRKLFFNHLLNKSKMDNSSQKLLKSFELQNRNLHQKEGNFYHHFLHYC